MNLKFLFILSLIFSSILCDAQYNIYQKDMNENGAITYARLSTDTLPVRMQNADKLLRDVHKMRSEDAFVLKATSDNLGYKNQYYQQFYKNVKVEYGVYSVHSTRDGNVEMILGDFHPIGVVNVTPKLKESQALQFALKYINADVYKWQIPEEEQFIKNNFNDSYFPKGDIVIVKDRLKTNKQYRLAYKLDIYAHKPISRNFVYVDAISGEIIEMVSTIFDGNANGTADLKYSGTKSITSDNFSSGYRLRELRNNVSIETYNMNMTSNYSKIDFIDNDNNWSAAEFNNTNMDNAALDAHWGAEMVYEYFRQKHSRNSYNGNGGAIISWVHANLKLMGYSSNDNAFWDGQRITYGDGSTIFYPLTSLDVCAHEIGHGVCGSSAKLRYQGESGAINEGLSDIWAACVEHFASPNKQIWLIGEDISRSGIPLRNMSNPNYGLSPQPDTYGGTYWVNPNSYYDNGGVHTNSGVLNYWFYLISQGGRGTNDLNNKYLVIGMGIENAAKIVYHTENVILKSTSERTVTFNQFREATITAARQLFGTNSNEIINLTNAWYAVGVGSKSQIEGNLISGNNNICLNSNTTFNLPSSFSNSQISWSCSSNILLNSFQGISASFSAITNGQGWIQATVDGYSITKEIWVGEPSTPLNINGFSFNGKHFGSNSYYDFSVNALLNQGTSLYEWSVGGGTIEEGQGTNQITVLTSIARDIDIYFDVNVRVGNVCGWSPWLWRTGYVDSGVGPAYIVSPNPANSNITVSKDENYKSNQTITQPEPIKSIRLFDKMGLPVMIQNYSGKDNSVTVNVSSLSKGIYIIKINEKESHTIIKE